MSRWSISTGTNTTSTISTSTRNRRRPGDTLIGIGTSRYATHIVISRTLIIVIAIRCVASH
jgi:hypothetical protein